MARRCSVCDSLTTYIRNNGRPEWRYSSVGKLLCKKCYHHLIANPRYNPINGPRRIVFLGKRITIEKIRIGVCNFCRSVKGFDCKQTQWHHDDNRYDRDDPEKFTLESCPKCHIEKTILHTLDTKGMWGGTFSKK